jgi:hypothetical protein
VSGEDVMGSTLTLVDVEIPSVVKLDLRRSLLALYISNYWVNLLAHGRFSLFVNGAFAAAFFF